VVYVDLALSINHHLSFMSDIRATNYTCIPQLSKATRHGRISYFVATNFGYEPDFHRPY